MAFLQIATTSVVSLLVEGAVVSTFGGDFARLPCVAHNYLLRFSVHQKFLVILFFGKIKECFWRKEKSLVELLLKEN